MDGGSNEVTSRLTKSKGRLTALMRLTYLAPDIIEDILAGQQPPELSPKRLLRTSQDLPLEIGASSVGSCVSSSHRALKACLDATPPAPKVDGREDSQNAGQKRNDFRLWGTFPAKMHDT